MDEKSNDVKPTDASSASVEAPATPSEEKVATLTEKDASKSVEDVKKEPSTMAEVAAEVAKKHGLGEESKSDSTEVGATEKKDEGTKEETLVEDEKIPEHIPYARFKEVNEKAKELERKYTEAEPVVQHHTAIVEYCKTNGITQAQFSEVLELASLINSNPAKAVELLTSKVQELQGFVGDVLPEDLQKKVDDGKLAEEDAKEIAALRAKTKYVESKTKQGQELAAREAENKFQRDLHSATSSWVKSKAKTDPDMREGTEKYQIVSDKFHALAFQQDEKGKYLNPVVTVEDYVKLLDKAYESVNKFTSQLTKGNKVNSQKVLTSTTSSVTAEVEPKTMQDIMRKVGSKHGIAV